MKVTVLEYSVKFRTIGSIKQSLCMGRVHLLIHDLIQHYSIFLDHYTRLKISKLSARYNIFKSLK